MIQLGKTLNNFRFPPVMEQTSTITVFTTEVTVKFSNVQTKPSPLDAFDRTLAEAKNVIIFFLTSTAPFCPKVMNHLLIENSLLRISFI